MVEIKFLGHSSVKLKFKDVNVLVDPYFSSSSTQPEFKRIVKNPFKEEDLKNIDLILLTQDQFDHFDKKAVEFFGKRDNSLVVGTQDVLNELTLPASQLVPIQARDKKNLRGVEIEVHPAHHPKSFYPVSYLIKKDGTKIFHAGDTSLTQLFEELKADVALLPIGGKITMDLVDAVKATKTMKPDYVIPIHYNTFEAIKVDPREFVQRIEKSILKTQAIVLEPGKSFKFKK